jgi:predicted nucleotidyltransferase
VRIPNSRNPWRQLSRWAAAVGDLTTASSLRGLACRLEPLHGIVPHMPDSGGRLIPKSPVPAANPPGTADIAQWLQSLAVALAADPVVEAITITGSAASGAVGTDSDVDLFAYATSDVTATRTKVAGLLGDAESHLGIGETAFGDADTWRHRDSGILIDISWWTPGWAESQLDLVLRKHRASLGYTTAFWRSIRNGRPLFERGTWHPQLQKFARSPYPRGLRKAIVETNRPWLSGHPFSYRHQIEVAISRSDAVSVNHRMAAWVASYFDIVFATNSVLHPGEKRMIEAATRECARLPQGMAHDLAELLRTSTPLPTIDRMLDKLDELVASTPAG